MSRFLPLKNNKFMNYENKFHFSTALDFLLDPQKNTSSEFIKNYKVEDFNGIFPFVINYICL